MVNREERLIKRAKNGDQEAFAELFEPLRPKIYGVACEVVGHNEADDVVMETYVKAWKALPTYQENAQLMTWLYRIARNCAIDFTRRRQRRREVPMPENDAGKPTIDELPDQRQPSPSHRLTVSEEQAMVLKAIDQLDDIHGVTLKLRYIHGLSYKEIAASTGVSIGTVMSRLFHARLKLKRILRNMDDEP